jgi:hypothetical protein
MCVSDWADVRFQLRKLTCWILTLCFQAPLRFRNQIIDLNPPITFANNGEPVFRNENFEDVYARLAYVDQEDAVSRKEL